MAMIRMFVSEWRQLWHDGHDLPARSDAARLRHKMWRKEIGAAVILLGAAAVLSHLAAGLSWIAR